MDSRSMLWLLEHSIRRTLEEFSEGTPVIPEPKHLLHSLFLKDIDSADLLREANEEEYGVRIVYFFVRNISVAQNIGITFAISGETPLETALHHLDEAQTCKFGKNEHENDELQNELAKIKTETLIQAVLVAARTRDTRYARGIFTRHSNFLTKSQRESIQCVLLGMEDFEKDFISYEQYLKKVQHLTTHMLKMTKPVIMRQVSQSFLDRVGRGGKAFREMAEILDSDNDDTISKLGGIDSEKKLRHRQRSDIEDDDVVRNSRDNKKIPSANKITHKLSNGVGHKRDQILHSDMINSDGSDCDSPIIFKSHQIGSLNEQMMEGDSKVPESGQSNAPASADMPGPSNRSEMPDDFAAPKLPTIRPRPQNRRRTISRASFAADPSPPRRGSSQTKAFSVIGAGGSKPTHRRNILPTPPASFAVRSNAGWSSATGLSSHRKHPFNPLQDSYIIMGVEKYGFGHWAKIRKEYAFPEYRTSVHLKDRWRTLLSQKAITVRADGEIILSEQYETTIKYLKENHTLTAEGATLPTFELKKTRTERRATKVRESESSGIKSPYYRSPAVSGDSDDNRPNMRGFDAVEKWRRSERGSGHPVKRKIPPLLLKNKPKSKHPESRGDEGPKENHIHPRLTPPAYGNSRNDKSPPSTTKPRNLSGGDNIQSTSRGPQTSNATLLHALLPQPDQTEKRSDVSHSTGVNPTNRNSPPHTPTGAGNVSGGDNIRSTSKGPPTNVPQNKRFVNLGPASFEKNENPALMEKPGNLKVPKNHNNSSTALMENPEILSPALMGNRVNPLLMKSDKNSSPASMENHENSSPSLTEKRNNSSPVLMRNQNISKPVLTENDKISETEEVVIIEDDSSDEDPPSSSLDHAGNKMIQGSNAAAVDNTLTGVLTGAVMNQNDNVTQESVRKHVNQGVSDTELENNQQTHAGYEMVGNSDERGSGISQPNSDVRLTQENICQGVDSETTIGLLTGHAAVPESSSDRSEDSFIVVDDVESYSYSIASEISSVASDSLIQRQASPILGATSGWGITRGCGVPNDGDTPSTDDTRVTTDGEETGKAHPIQAKRGPASDGHTIGDNREASASAQGDGAGDRSPKKNSDTSGLASRNILPVKDVYPSSPSIYFSADEGWLGSPENQQNDTLLGPDESPADRVDTTASGPLEPGANDGDRSQAELENTITGDTESVGEESSSERVLDAEIPDNLEQFLQDNPVSAPSSSSASQPISQSGENDGRISNGNTQSSSATTSSAPHQASSPQELFESGKNKDDSVGNTNCQTDGTGIMVPEKNLRTSPPSPSQQSKTRIKKRKKTKGNTTTNVPYRHQPSGGGEVDETETNTHCNVPSAPQNSKSSKKPTKTADGNRERAKSNSGTATSDSAMDSSAEILAVTNLDSSSGQGPNQTFQSSGNQVDTPAVHTMQQHEQNCVENVTQLCSQGTNGTQGTSGTEMDGLQGTSGTKTDGEQGSLGEKMADSTNDSSVENAAVANYDVEMVADDHRSFVDSAKKRTKLPEEPLDFILKNEPLDLSVSPNSDKAIDPAPHYLPPTRRSTRSRIRAGSDRGVDGKKRPEPAPGRRAARKNAQRYSKLETQTLRIKQDPEDHASCSAASENEQSSRKRVDLCDPAASSMSKSPSTRRRVNLHQRLTRNTRQNSETRRNRAGISNVRKKAVPPTTDRLGSDACETMSTSALPVAQVPQGHKLFPASCATRSRLQDILNRVKTEPASDVGNVLPLPGGPIASNPATIAPDSATQGNPAQKTLPRLRRRKRRLINFDQEGVPMKLSKQDEELFEPNFVAKAKACEVFTTVGKRKGVTRKQWTAEEDENLLEGVGKHGIGNWKLIADSYVFHNRTATNLKDRYRVLNNKNQTDETQKGTPD